CLGLHPSSRPVHPDCCCEKQQRYGMGRQTPRTGTKVAIEAERAGRGKGREQGDGLQERCMLRCKTLRLLRQEQDDHPGTQEPDGQRYRRAHHDSEQYCQGTHTLYPPSGFPHLLCRTARSSLTPKCNDSRNCEPHECCLKILAVRPGG